VEAAHVDATALLSEHRAQLDSLVDALLHHETLDADAARAAAGIEAPAAPPVLTLASTGA
jgi:ATP-dependent Zn protease